MSKTPSDTNEGGVWRIWLHLTREERNLVLGILLIALIGLTARYLHVKHQTPDAPPTPATSTQTR